MSDKKISPQEILIGLVATVVAIFIYGIWGYPIVIAGAVLWPLGGTYWKPIRRWGLPLGTFAILFGIHGFHLNDVLATALRIAILYIGDGFPDRRPTTADEGSWLGRLVEKVFPDDRVGGPVTKWLIVPLYQIPLLLR